jgi:hypothetical protein
VARVAALGVLVVKRVFLGGEGVENERHDEGALGVLPGGEGVHFAVGREELAR